MQLGAWMSRWEDFLERSLGTDGPRMEIEAESEGYGQIMGEMLGEHRGYWGGACAID